MKNFSLKSILAMLWIALLSVGCTEEAEDLFGNIYGQVTDADTRELLKGVSVSISPQGDSQVTGSDGTYSFRELAPTDYTLTFKAEGYETTTRKFTVQAGVNTQGDMQLTPLRPLLSVSPTTVDFGSENTTLTLDIANAGKGVLQWSITEDIEWLDCSVLSGAVEKEPASVVLSVSRVGWVKGSYSRTLAVASNGGSAVVTVNMTVDGCSLSVEPEEIDFGSTESTVQLTLTNKGNGTISYQAASSNDWLGLSKTSGKVTDKDYLTVSANRGSLDAGEYTGTVTITVDEDVIQIPVKLSVSAKSRPVISLDAIKNIAYNGATLAGTVVDVGTTRITRYGFCWSQQAEPTVADACTNMGDCSVPLSFEGVITDLAPNAKYYVRAYAENDAGITYSNEEAFTTAGVPVVPTVQTQETTDVKSRSAMAHGLLSNLGNVTSVAQYGHVWSDTSDKPEISLSTRTELGQTEQPLSFNSEMTALKPNRKYYVRAYATNEKGTAYGETLSFTTLADDVLLTTSEVTDIIHNAATCGGSVSDYGGNSLKECGICWSLKEDAVSVSDWKAVGTLANDRWSCRMEELAKETAYYVRAYVQTVGGATYYGEVRRFVTSKEVKLPALAAVSVSGIDTQGATLQGSLTDKGNSEVTACGFCWSTEPDPTVESESVACQLQNMSFGQKISGLKDGTKYYVRAYATNALGTGYSETTEFSTVAITVPVWGNATVSNIGKTKANVSATLTSAGNAEVTEMGICWSTHPETTIYDNKQVCAAGNSLSTQLTGLQGTTTYYLRAYAQNSKGVGYSNEVVFTTTDSEVDVWDGVSVATSFAGGIGTEADPIRIETAAQLKLLADKVNAGTTYAGVYFKLTSNIDLNNREWTSIGWHDYNSNGRPFCGNFSIGNNHITGLKAKSENKSCGLFGYLKDGSISNGSVEGDVSAQYHAAVLCGYVSGESMIHNIETLGDVSGDSFIGGIIGNIDQYGVTSVINSINRANIKSMAGTGSYAYSGGIIGYTYGGTRVNNCCNYSDVKKGADPEAMFGAVCGYSTSYYYSADKVKHYIGAIVDKVYWLNDMVGNVGLEQGFGINYNFRISDCGYFTRNSSSCTLIQMDSKDLVETLNQWVDENGPSTYRRWEYKVIDGYACPVLK